MMLGACRFFISIQFMGFVEILLLALSLSADSFVVSMGGSVSLGKVRPLKVLQVAMVFGVVQSACLFAGWISGYSIVAYISRVANYIALAVLGYLGVSMFVAGIRNSSESVDLGGMKSLCVAAVATSVDAIAVGVSLAMGDTGFADAFLATVLTFAITVIACVFGITAGAATGRIFGNAARIAGGLVLIFIGLKPFFS